LWLVYLISAIFKCKLKLTNSNIRLLIKIGLKSTDHEYLELFDKKSKVQKRKIQDPVNIYEQEEEWQKKRQSFDSKPMPTSMGYNKKVTIDIIEMKTSQGAKSIFKSTTSQACGVADIDKLLKEKESLSNLVIEPYIEILCKKYSAYIINYVSVHSFLIRGECDLLNEVNMKDS